MKDNSNTPVVVSEGPYCKPLSLTESKAVWNVTLYDGNIEKSIHECSSYDECEVLGKMEAELRDLPYENLAEKDW